jgi:hypothetical protein
MVPGGRRDAVNVTPRRLEISPFVSLIDVIDVIDDGNVDDRSNGGVVICLLLHSRLTTQTEGLRRGDG